MNNYIKKIKIETVESFLGIQLARNKVSIGFDVATYKTGIAIISTTNDYLILEHTHKINVPKLPKNSTTREQLNNVNIFLDQLEDFKRTIVQKYRLDIVKIEDCFMGQNVKTLKALARYSVLVYDRFRGLAKNTDYILPSPARSRINFKKSNKTIKGTKLKKEIIEYINMALGTEIKDEDIADGTVLALAGLVEK